jgi:deoxyribonuclease-4
VQGFDITDPEHLGQVLDEADAKVGLKRLGCVHVNDAGAPFNSCRDRHANIGDGEMGRNGLAAFLSEPRFEGLPAPLEVPGPNKRGPDRKQVEKAKRLRERGLKSRNG